MRIKICKSKGKHCLTFISNPKPLMEELGVFLKTTKVKQWWRYTKNQGITKVMDILQYK